MPPLRDYSVGGLGAKPVLPTRLSCRPPLTTVPSTRPVPPYGLFTPSLEVSPLGPTSVDTTARGAGGARGDSGRNPLWSDPSGRNNSIRCNDTVDPPLPPPPDPGAISSGACA